MNSVTIHGVLALAGLAFAYQTYTREPDKADVPGQVTLLECDPKDVTALELETATQLMSVQPKKGADGIEYWLTTTRRKKPDEKKPEEKKPDATAEAKPADGKPPEGGSKAPSDAKDAKDAKNAKDALAAKPGDKPEAKPAEAAKPELDKPARANDPDAPVNFLGNQKFADALKQLAPMQAMRSLGEIPKDKFEQFGFDKIDTHLKIECGGRKLALDVGGRTYGAGDRYSRDPKSGQSYLLSGQLITDLESARFKFMQNDLNTFELKDVDQATVKALGKERKLAQRNRGSAQEARWVDAAAPDKRNELFNTWFQRVARLKVKSYLPEGAEPGSDLQVEASGTTPVVAIEYTLEGKPKGKLEIVRVDAKKESLFYARSETTKRWVAVYDSLATQVEEDTALVVGAEEPKESASPTRKEAKPAAEPAPAQLPAGHPPLH